MCWTYFKTIEHRPVTRGKGGEASPANIRHPGKICWALKTIGHSLKNLGPCQKILRHPWCPKLVLGLIGHSLKIWAPLRKLFAPPGVPSWLRAWANRLMDCLFWRIIVMWHWSWDGYPRVVQKETQTEFYLIVLTGILQSQNRPLASSYLFLWIHLHTFSWFWLVQ